MNELMTDVEKRMSNSTTVSFDTILASNALFEVPQYQRPYTWGKKETIENVLKFVEDSLEQFETDESPAHFFNSIILLRKPKKESQKETIYEIVDGQQRLITFQLLLLAIYANKDELYKQAEQYIASQLKNNSNINLEKAVRNNMKQFDAGLQKIQDICSVKTGNKFSPEYHPKMKLSEYRETNNVERKLESDFTDYENIYKYVFGAEIIEPNIHDKNSPVLSAFEKINDWIQNDLQEQPEEGKGPNITKYINFINYLTGSDEKSKFEIYCKIFDNETLAQKHFDAINTIGVPLAEKDKINNRMRLLMLNVSDSDATLQTLEQCWDDILKTHIYATQKNRYIHSFFTDYIYLKKQAYTSKNPYADFCGLFEEYSRKNQYTEFINALEDVKKNSYKYQYIKEDFLISPQMKDLFFYLKMCELSSSSNSLLLHFMNELNLEVVSKEIKYEKHFILDDSDKDFQSKYQNFKKMVQYWGIYLLTIRNCNIETSSLNLKMQSLLSIKKECNESYDAFANRIVSKIVEICKEDIAKKEKCSVEEVSILDEIQKSIMKPLFLPIVDKKLVYGQPIISKNFLFHLMLQESRLPNMNQNHSSFPYMLTNFELEHCVPQKCKNSNPELAPYVETLGNYLLLTSEDNKKASSKHIGLKSEIYDKYQNLGQNYHVLGRFMEIQNIENRTCSSLDSPEWKQIAIDAVQENNRVMFEKYISLFELPEIIFPETKETVHERMMSTYDSSMNEAVMSISEEYHTSQEQDDDMELI